MKQLILSLLVLLFCNLSQARAQYFTIGSFNADILVNEDATLTVKETIEVFFNRQRHGIFREIPFHYTDSLGKKIRTPLTVVSTADENGLKRRHRISRSGDFVRIRIGHPEKFVQGRQVYVLTYKVENALLFLEDHDELYWNVTGNEWPTTISNSSARVIVEAGKTTPTFRAICFTGTYGSKESSCDSSALSNGGIFRARKVLKSEEGFTIVLGWPKGIIKEPSYIKKLFWSLNLRENWIFLVPVFAFIFMFMHWRRRGKDPDVGETVAVMYKPPEENGRSLLPAEIGGLMDEKIDPRDITASIVNLAVKKYIVIEELKTEGILFDKTDYRLEKRKDPDKDLSDFETALISEIFGSSGSVLVSDLENRFYKSIKELKIKVFNSLKKDGYYTAIPEKVKNKYFGLAIATAAFAGLTVLFFGRFIYIDIVKLWLTTGLSGFAVAVFAPVMPARTRKGALAFMELRGFEEFLSRAEKDRLERMKDINLFEKYLPYAIALGVSDRWAGAFANIYQRQPDWYISTGGHETFNPVSFNRSLGKALSNMGSALYSAPRSSGGGFSGGGFSGGGFGGGGGGSW